MCIKYSGLMQVGKIRLDTMASADSISTLDIDKVLDVASPRMGYEKGCFRSRETL